MKISPIKSAQKEGKMETKDYKIVEITGEYAYLEDISAPGSERLFIALALLPPGVDVGDELRYENFSFSVK